MNLLATSVSGLVAAQQRMSASASNIANQSTAMRVEEGELVNKPYEPVDAVSLSQEPSGVLSSIEPRGDEPVVSYAPFNPAANESGNVALPNIDVASETIEQMLASQQFLANLEMIERSDDALGSLLNRTE